MEEDHLITLIFSFIAFITLLSAVFVVVPGINITGFASYSPKLNPMYLLFLPIILFLMFVAYKPPKKVNPLKNYVKHSQKRGLSDVQIANNLLEVGWNESEIKEFLKFR
tara:strand:- start:368 stop:694 length:327 start_codon:yes stop_codon:yes gene_type:complete